MLLSGELEITARGGALCPRHYPLIYCPRHWAAPIKPNPNQKPALPTVAAV
eukprot:SAG22_NODE_221_length_14781_cov_82.531490_14_plen_51_part_00